MTHHIPIRFEDKLANVYPKDVVILRGQFDDIPTGTQSIIVYMQMKLTDTGILDISIGDAQPVVPDEDDPGVPELREQRKRDERAALTETLLMMTQYIAAVAAGAFVHMQEAETVAKRVLGEAHTVAKQQNALNQEFKA